MAQFRWSGGLGRGAVKSCTKQPEDEKYSGNNRHRIKQMSTMDPDTSTISTTINLDKQSWSGSDVRRVADWTAGRNRHWKYNMYDLQHYQ